MQKWEYLFADFDFKDDAWRLQYLSNQDLQAKLEGAYQDVVAATLGEQGWEMISYNLMVSSVPRLTGFTALNQIRMVFKRPKP